jgi:hypothetical protein
LVAGLVFTVNALSPKDINLNGVPRQVLGRDVFNAKSAQVFVCFAL